MRFAHPIAQFPTYIEGTMRTGILAGSFLAGLALMAAPLHGQRVSAEVVVRGGPVAGRVVVGERYPAYRHRELYRRHPGRRVVVAERYHPRVIVVERFDRHHGKPWKRDKYWKRGYRLVTVYYIDGRYYDRFDTYYPDVQEVVVYERNGRFYRDD
jgi:hypothetical protein